LPINRTPLAAAALAVAVLVPAAAAGAATKSVTLGYAGKPPAGTPETAAFFDFFPAKVTIRAGDKVAYTIAGLGVPYSGPKRGIGPLPGFDPAAPVAGVMDPAGNPFAFNGQPGAQINPEWLADKGDGKVKKGQKDIDHGSLSLGTSKPYQLTFAKPGTYKVRDALHPGVVNTVKVVKKSARVPGKAADRAAIAKQLAAAVKSAKQLAKVTPPADTVLVGHDSKKIGFFQFFPDDLTVKAGAPVTVDTGSVVADVHDLVIGPEDFMKANSAEQGLFQPGPSGVGLAAAAVYPSQGPFGTAVTFDGTQNGGFVNTGALDTDPATPLPSKTTITFTKPGTYRYVCLFHSDGVNGMAGTITVE